MISAWILLIISLMSIGREAVSKSLLGVSIGGVMALIAGLEIGGVI